MEITEFKDTDKDLYNKFLFDSRYKDILQSWEWGEVKPKLNWITHRIGFFENNNLCGIAQILEKRLPFGFFLLYWQP